MNDNELVTIVRESVADVHSATPVAQIISHGRAIRARRRTPALAGAAAIVAGTALTVTTLLPSGHPGVRGTRHPGNGPLAGARLAAWTVAKQADGDIDVTINQLQNPAGLQATLRADGLPVNVTFSGHSLTASCQLYPTSTNVLNAIAHFPGGGSTAGGTVYLIIKPSALPTGAGLAMFVGGSSDEISMPSSPPPGTAGGTSEFTVSSSGNGQVRTAVGVTVSPVYASQQCTGS
jgi:hypothetical protein